MIYDKYQYSKIELSIDGGDKFEVDSICTNYAGSILSYRTGDKTHSEITVKSRIDAYIIPRKSIESITVSINLAELGIDNG